MGKDSEITAVEPGHAEMTLQTNDTEHVISEGLHGAVCIGLADSVMGTACLHWANLLALLILMVTM